MELPNFLACANLLSPRVVLSNYPNLPINLFEPCRTERERKQAERRTQPESRDLTTLPLISAPDPPKKNKKPEEMILKSVLDTSKKGYKVTSDAISI